MPLLPLEQLLTHVDSKYRLVIIAARRAKQLMRGAEPLLAPKSYKATYIALEEVAAGRLSYETEAAAGALAQELVAPEPTTTWFRSLSGETLAEGVAIGEEEEEREGVEPEEAPLELLAEPSETEGEPEVTELETPGAPEAGEDEA